MNIAVINIKEILKHFVKMLFAILIIFISTKIISNLGINIKESIMLKADTSYLKKCIEISIPNFKNETNENKNTINVTTIMGKEIALLNTELTETTNSTSEETIENQVENNETETPDITISKNANTEEVTDRNFSSKATNYYNTTKIDNQSDYTITEEMLTPDKEITDKKNILIYHTHTCESYTPCETYNYTMTGNYRTTDSNYNVVRVGSELTKYLTEKGFNVVHDATYFDYPSYSGSYSRSLEKAEQLLEEQSAEIVIDLHRDAVGNGDTYGPTVLIDGQRVAQLMFVIGTDGGGLEHPNWVDNLKIAVRIQEKANEMYPGLFRSIIIRNSRYNQHIASGASIIEVGATANTLGECLLSMQCLANVLEEVCK